jgi:hypothetical protein
VFSQKPLRTGFRRGHVWLGALLLLWLGAVGTGLWAVWAYDNRPGPAAAAPPQWPSTTALVPNSAGATLVFLAHPQCTCTAASLDELAEILARASTRPRTYVLFLKPSGVEDGWEQTELWRRAAQLPGVRVLRDDNGVEARHFGVETSGQTMLYDRHGALVFSGGITGSRGHAGENAGELTLISLLSDGRANRRATNVFGCPLFAEAE